MAPKPKAVVVSRLKYRLRNQNADLELPRLAVLVGANGSGKTSVINAVELALRGFATEVGLWAEVKQAGRLASLIEGRAAGTASAVATLSDGTVYQWGMTAVEEGGKLQAKMRKPASNPPPVDDSAFIVQWLEKVLSKESARDVLLSRIGDSFALPAPTWLAEEVVEAQGDGEPDMHRLNALAKLVKLRARLAAKQKTLKAVQGEVQKEELEKQVQVVVTPIPGVAASSAPAPDYLQLIRVFFATRALSAELPEDIRSVLERLRAMDAFAKLSYYDWLSKGFSCLYNGVAVEDENPFKAQLESLRSKLSGSSGFDSAIVEDAVTSAVIHGQLPAEQVGSIGFMDVLQCAAEQHTHRVALAQGIHNASGGVFMEHPSYREGIDQDLQRIATRITAYNQITAAYPELWAALETVNQYQEWLQYALSQNEAYFPIAQAFERIRQTARHKAGIQ